jgi:anti-anti-sigma factor
VEIQRRSSGKATLLDVSGKLDAYWSGALSQEIEACVHAGASEVALDLADVDFISSAGLRVLLIWLKQMKAINGNFRIVRPSAEVLSILDMSGLSELLLTAAGDGENGQIAPEIPFADGSGRYTVIPLGEVLPTQLEVVEAPRPGQAHTAFPLVRYPSGKLGIGIGAFGDLGSGSTARFGEFLSACGVTVCLPTDGRGHPDYMMEDGAFVPTISTYSGVSSDAEFSQVLLFEADDATSGIPLSALSRLALKTSGLDAVMLLIVAEVNYLIGAAAKAPPLDSNDLFAFPRVRDTMHFTTEPASENTIALVCGVAAAQRHAYLRPMGQTTDLYGHFHAISFSKRPMPAGLFDPKAMVRRLFDEERIQALLHLLIDDRHVSAVVESEFSRGSVWVHPLHTGRRSAE